MRPFRVRIARAAKLAFAEIRGRRTAYEAASFGRAYSDWIASARFPDDELRGDAVTLRARARELARNNAYAKRYLRLLTSNVVGPRGIRLQAQVWNGQKLDRAANAAIEAAWNDWAGHKVTVDGRLTLRQTETLMQNTEAVDGEIFVRLWSGFDRNPYGLGIQLIDADLLDIRFNRQAGNGLNEIRLGVEVDALSRPVGYHFWKTSRSGFSEVVRERYFVPAAEVVHLYNSERANQTRGVTWFRAAMAPAHMLDGYEVSEAIASRTASSKMGFFVQKSDSLPEAPSTTKPITMESEPGTAEALDPGWGFEPWDPQHPTAQFSSFVKQMLRKISSAWSVFYNVLANDAEQVTYSTMRSFSLVERDEWRTLQEELIETWRRPLYEAWIRNALLTGALRLPSLNPLRYMSVRHRPRGWSWIDPEKEVNAASKAIDRGLGTRTQFLAEKGEDFEEVCDELKREQDIASALGIDISGALDAGEKKLTQAEWEAQQEEDGGGTADQAAA